MNPFDAVDNWLFIDPGGSTGVCHVREGAPILTTIRIPKTSLVSVGMLIYRNAIAEKVRQTAPRVLVVEQYAFAATGNAVIKMAEIGTLVRLTAWEKDVPVIEMVSSLWKSITFRGRKGVNKALDADYIYQAEQLTGIRAANVDEADALLMAFAAGTILGDLTRRTDGMMKFRVAAARALAEGEIKEDENDG